MKQLSGAAFAACPHPARSDPAGARPRRPSAGRLAPSVTSAATGRDVQWETRALSNRSLLLTARRRFTAAKADLDEPKELCDTHGLTLAGAYVEQNLGCLHADRGDVPEALRRFDSAAALYEEMGVEVGSLLVDRAKVLLSVRLVDEARESAGRSAHLRRSTSRAGFAGGAAHGLNGRTPSARSARGFVGDRPLGDRLLRPAGPNRMARAGAVCPVAGAGGARTTSSRAIRTGRAPHTEQPRRAAVEHRRAFEQRPWSSSVRGGSSRLWRPGCSPDGWPWNEDTAERPGRTSPSRLEHVDPARQMPAPGRRSVRRCCGRPTGRAEARTSPQRRALGCWRSTSPRWARPSSACPRLGAPGCLGRRRTADGLTGPQRESRPLVERTGGAPFANQTRPVRPPDDPVLARDLQDLRTTMAEIDAAPGVPGSPTSAFVTRQVRLEQEVAATHIRLSQGTGRPCRHRGSDRRRAGVRAGEQGNGRARGTWTGRCMR